MSRYILPSICIATSTLTSYYEFYLDFYYDFYRNEPGYAAIWSGVEAMPELRELDFQELYHNARDVDARLKQVFPHLSDTRRWNASLLLPRSTGSMLRLAVTLPETEATQLIAEIKRMARAYLKELATA